MSLLIFYIYLYQNILFFQYIIVGEKVETNIKTSSMTVCIHINDYAKIILLQLLSITIKIIVIKIIFLQRLFSGEKNSPFTHKNTNSEI